MEEKVLAEKMELNAKKERKLLFSMSFTSEGGWGSWVDCWAGADGFCIGDNLSDNGESSVVYMSIPNGWLL